MTKYSSFSLFPNLARITQSANPYNRQNPPTGDPIIHTLTERDKKMKRRGKKEVLPRKKKRKGAKNEA